MKHATVDANHIEYIKFLEKEREKLPLLLSQLNKKQLISKNLQSKSLKELSQKQIKFRHKIKKEIKQLIHQITDLKSNTLEIEYFLKAGKYITDYYDHVRPAQHKKTNTNLTRKITSERITADDSTEMKGPLGKFCVITNNTFKRGDCLSKYRNAVDPHYVRFEKVSTEESDICEQCNVPRIALPNESKLICPECGDEKKRMVVSDRPSYKEPPPENTYFQYKMSNHFNEELANCQGKENKDIPKKVYDAINYEMKRERIEEAGDLTYDQVKRFLKKHKFNSHYKHIARIIYNLTGIRPISMSLDMEEEFRTMFRMVVTVWEKYKPPKRKNFMSYPYIFHQFSVIKKDEDPRYKVLIDFRENDDGTYYFGDKTLFHLLKSSDKRYEQDTVWRKICNHFGWKFHSTLGI